jgi:nucleoside-diphosphate-sugar epimerase
MAPLEKVSGEIFNVGDTKENFTIEGIAEEVQRQIPHTIIKKANTIRDRRDYRVSFKKINSILKWNAQRKLPEGIKEMARALKQDTFKNWKGKQYSNYLTLKSVFTETT